MLIQKQYNFSPPGFVFKQLDKCHIPPTHAQGLTKQWYVHLKCLN